MKLRYIAGGILLLFLSACKPEPPVSSSITIDLEKLALPANEDLYGVTLEELNHAVEGGISAELIQNRSFEDGAVPAGCSYDAAQNCITTPIGWKIPFVRPGTIPGWRTLSEHTVLSIDTHEPLNESNRRSLFVRVASSGSGGAVAEGFHGIALCRGEQYDLSFYLRGEHGGHVSIELRDTMANRLLAEPHRVQIPSEWTQIRHSFTATDSIRNATLVFAVDSNVSFSLDMVSLFPQKTWKNHGLREDLMAAVAALNPKFVRFPGGSFAEGYTNGTTPRWDETIGSIESRKPMWSIWGYGTTNGVGFHEYLQLSEDLQARPIYVMNAGVLNQRYRTRFEDMKNMNYVAQRAERAIAYANRAATDSVYGNMRAANGHAEPFNLSMVEFGDANHGGFYAQRYQYLRETLRDTFPQVAVMATDTMATQLFHEDWTDMHYTMSANNLISMSNCFDVENLDIHTPMSFVGAFGAAYTEDGGTMRAAVGEAAFLIGAERHPVNVKGVAYSPLLGHAGFYSYGAPAIQFDASRMVKTPSYYLLEMFANNRGNEVLVTDVDTYQKPLVSYGRASIILFDDDYEAKGVMMNGVEMPTAFVKDDRTNVKLPKLPVAKKILKVSPITSRKSKKEKIEKKENPPKPKPKPKPKSTTTNQQSSSIQAAKDVSKKYQMFGDSTAYNYTFSVQIRRTQSGGQIQLHVRDNGLVEEQGNCVSLVLTDSVACLYHFAGVVRQPLTLPLAISLPRDQWVTVKIECQDEKIHCMIGDDELEASIPSSPSIVAVATRDVEAKKVILKVVNTTMHEEWTSLHINGGSVDNDAEVIQLTGRADDCNTLEHPSVVVPRRKEIKFSMRRPIRYVFPANSVTVITMKIK